MRFQDDPTVLTLRKADTIDQTIDARNVCQAMGRSKLLSCHRSVQKIPHRLMISLTRRKLVATLVKRPCSIQSSKFNADKQDLHAGEALPLVLT